MTGESSSSPRATVRLERVSFSYPSRPLRLFEKLDLSLHDGWCGVVGANGSGKSTLLSLIAGLIEPDSGQIHAPPALLCKQELGDVTQIREDALTRWDQRAMMLRELLQLEDAHLWRWEQLSSGEQKRWQIGHALMMHPAVLLLDEPTNHLDIDAKNLLIEALQTFEGTGVLISHDRHLLDAVTSRDIPVVADVVMVLVALVLLISFLSDVVTVSLDPRLRVVKEASK